MNPPVGTAEFMANEIQKLWFATQKKEWASLAIIPAAPGFSMVPLAKALAKAGENYLDREVRLILGEGTDLNSASRIIIEMTSQVSYGHCVIVALDSVIHNAAGIPVVLAADACLLGIQLKESRFAQATRTVEMVGASRFVGVVTLPPPPTTTLRSPRPAPLRPASSAPPQKPPPLHPSAAPTPASRSTSNAPALSSPPKKNH
ncbi:MAG: hypothetical protein FWG75_08955 [Cystobacterineae bacterium]|nr:hypothetical protein [Cystobacterineae bacterium]